MEALFSQNTGYIIERLQAKLKFQADEISHLRLQLEHSSCSNWKNLQQLFQNYSHSKSFQTGTDQSTQDCPADISKSDLPLAEVLTEEILKLEHHLEEEQKYRGRAQSEVKGPVTKALLNKQVLIEQRMFFQEVTSGYEEKIMELRRMLQEKENLLEAKMLKQSSGQDTFLEKKIRKEFISAEEPLILKKIIGALQQRIAKEIDAKESLQKELKELKLKYNHADQIFQLKFNRSIDDSFVTKQSKQEQELILFDDQEVESEQNYQSETPEVGLEKQKENSNDTVSDIEKILPRNCCKDFRMVLSKMSLKENSLREETRKLKQRLQEMCSSYNMIVKANLQKQSQIQSLIGQISCYKSALSNNRVSVPSVQNLPSESLRNLDEIKRIKQLGSELNKHLSTYHRIVPRKNVVCYSMPHTSSDKPKRKRPQVVKISAKPKYDPFLLEYSSVNISDVDVSRSCFRELQYI